MYTYLIIDLKGSTLSEGVVRFFHRDMQSSTPFIERAGRFPEAIVNQDLERYDNGSTACAVLQEALIPCCAQVQPVNKLSIHHLLGGNYNLPRRQAV